MAYWNRNPHGNNQHTDVRPNHRYGEAIIGRTFTAIFFQPLTGATRTVEVVRYQTADSWKARVHETEAVITRLGQQAEFSSAEAACRGVTELLGRQGMRISRQWEAGYSEWSAAAVPAATRRPQIPGGIRQ